MEVHRGRLDGTLVLIDYDMSWNDCLPCRRAGFAPSRT